MRIIINKPVEAKSRLIVVGSHASRLPPIQVSVPVGFGFRAVVTPLIAQVSEVEEAKRAILRG